MTAPPCPRCGHVPIWVPVTMLPGNFDQGVDHVCECVIASLERMGSGYGPRLRRVWEREREVRS